MTTSRYTLAAAVGALYTIAIAWLVGAEGQSYRASLKATRGARLGPVTVVTVDPAPSTSGKSVGPTIKSVAPTTETPSNSDRSVGPTIKNVGPTIKDAPPANPEPPAIVRNVPAPKPAMTPKAERKPAAPSPEAIWADTLDLATITPEQEMRLGGVLNQFVLRTNAVDPDGDIKRLRSVADPLLKFRNRPEITYTFNVLRSDEVNAFSLPGGFVYVSTGLFSLVGEDVDPENDYVLQFALGHEIGHVDLKHALKLIAPGNESAKKQGVDTLSQCLAPLISAYPDAMEFEADAWAYDRMRNKLEPRRTRREGLMFLVQFEGYSTKHGFRNGRNVVAPNVGVNLVENHYRAHTAGWERLNRLKELAGPLDAPAPSAKSR